MTIFWVYMEIGNKSLIRGFNLFIGSFFHFPTGIYLVPIMRKTRTYFCFEKLMKSKVHTRNFYFFIFNFYENKDVKKEDKV